MMVAMDEVVEERIWRRGVEIVSRVNWTLLGRLRRSLGVVGEDIAHNPMLIAARRAEARVVPIIAPRKRTRRDGERAGSEFGQARRSA